jgi:AcrR family transcriptional regulator
MSTVERNGEPGQRERILKIAARLFAERGYHAIGMSELGEAVQLGRGALYHHIRSKEDLLYDISREYIAELADFAERHARPEADPRKRIVMLGRQLLLKIASHQAELTVCFREIQSLTEPRLSEVLGLHAKYERVWRDTMVDGAELGFFRPYDPIVLKGVLGMYFYSYLWMRTDGRLTPAIIAERLNELALRMLDIQSPVDTVAGI